MLTIVWQIICQKVNSLIFFALGYKPYLGLIWCRNCLSCPIRVSICLSRHIMSRWHRPSLAREHHIFHALTGGGSRRRQTSPWVGAAWEWDGLHWNYPSWLVGFAFLLRTSAIQASLMALGLSSVDFVFLLLARHNPSELGILLLLRSSVQNEPVCLVHQRVPTPDSCNKEYNSQTAIDYP